MQKERDTNIAVMDQLDVTEGQGLYPGRRVLVVTENGFAWLIELTKSDMTTLWIRKEFETQSKLLPGSAQWMALGLQIPEQQSVVYLSCY